MVPRRLGDASDVAWRLLVVAAAVLAAGALLWKLRLVVLPLVIALILCSALTPAVTALERRGMRAGAAAPLVFFGFLATLAGILALIIPTTVDQLADTGRALEASFEDIEDWLVDGPLGLDRETVDDFADDPGATVSDWAKSSSGTLTRGALLAGEIIAGAVLALVLTFFILKDGRHIQTWVLGRVSPERRDLLRDASEAAWGALGGYLRGAALLGFVEGVIIGLAVWVVGGKLALPLAVFTFLGAFFPIVGAIVSGAVATLATLGTAGPEEALIVLAIAVVVQQLDNDVLAPVIYGRSLKLHPILVLVVLVAGGSLGGIAGAFLAVPVAGVTVRVGSVLWRTANPVPELPPSVE